MDDTLSYLYIITSVGSKVGTKIRKSRSKVITEYKVFIKDKLDKILITGIQSILLVSLVNLQEPIKIISINPCNLQCKNYLSGTKIE